MRKGIYLKEEPKLSDLFRLDSIAEIIALGLLVAYALDILYLYFAGGWCEPNTIIRITELAILIGTIPFVVWKIYYDVKRRFK